MFIGQDLQEIELSAKLSKHQTCSFLWVVCSETPRFLIKIDLKFKFSNWPNWFSYDSVLLIFNSTFCSNFELNLNFGQNKTCRLKQYLQLLCLEFCPIHNIFWNINFWIFGDFEKTLNFSLYFVFDCFHLNFLQFLPLNSKISQKKSWRVFNCLQLSLKVHGPNLCGFLFAQLQTCYNYLTLRNFQSFSV